MGPGEAFLVAVLFDIEPRWHIYWKNPGDGAPPPQIEVTAPQGFRIGPVRWTRPTLFETGEIRAFGYEKQAALFVPVTAPAELSDGRVDLRLAVRYAVCSDICLLGEAQRRLEVETSARPVQRSDPDALVDRHRRRLPRPLGEVPGAAMSFDGSLLHVSGPAQGRTTIAFFPDPSPGVVYGKVGSTIESDRFELRVRVTLEPSNALGEPMVMAGLVALGDSIDDPCFDFAVPGDQ